MADLHKFIRQQFSSNNWSKQSDLSKISVTKLKEIAEAFNQLDVKSKLTLIFTYANSPIPSDPEVAELVESVILQALDEDNNFVRCIATILHSRQNLGHLLFDLSDTSDSFAQTIASLTSCPTDGSNSSKIPPLAELLDSRITDGATNTSSLSSLSSMGLKNNCLNKFCGFKVRDKTPAQKMKESYLDRLQEECERRRVHVPIPGRSFGKQDGGEDVSYDSLNNHSSCLESSLGNRRAPSFPRRSFVARKADIHEGEALSSTTSNTSGSATNSSTGARAKLLALHNRGPATVASTLVSGGNSNCGSSNVAGNTSRRMMLLSSSTTDSGERNSLRHLNASSTSAGGNKRSSGIKLLDFQDLPAIGLQAKKLRKEQLEKEREEKRREREQKAQERREARDAARRARALAQASAAAVAVNVGGKNTTVQQSPPSSHSSQPPVVSQGLPLFQPLQHPQQLQQGLGTVATSTKPVRWDLQQPWTPFSVGPTRNHHHRVRNPNRQGGADGDGEDDDDEDYEDDDEEECEAVVGSDGAFHLTAPPGFRGFTEVLPQNSIALQSQQSSAPTATILLQRSTQGGHFVPQLITTSQQATSAQGNVFQAVPGGSRIRIVRPWAPTSQGQAPQEVPVSNEGVVAAASTRLVQLPDGRIAIATTAPPQLTQQPQSQNLQQQQQPQQHQQPAVIIANRGSRLQMAATPTAQISPSVSTPTLQTATGSHQQLLISSSALAAAASPQQQTAVMIAPSLPQATLRVPVGQALPVAATPRLQPRLLQIRPRTAVAATSASPVNPVVSSTATAAAAIPVILPSLNTSVANIASAAGSACGLQQQPHIVVANSLRQTAPTPTVHNPPQQQTLMRIVPRPAQSPLTPVNPAGTKPLLPQPQPLPQLVQPKEKIQLTSAQLTSIQTLFQGANRLTRPDKAIILSFVSGKRVNPQPEGGTALRIRLSEYRERVIDAASGNVMDVAAETFINLDYATGKFERIKSYRTLPPEQLMALPVQPKTTVTPAATATSSAT